MFHSYYIQTSIESHVHARKVQLLSTLMPVIAFISFVPVVPTIVFTVIVPLFLLPVLKVS